MNKKITLTILLWLMIIFIGHSQRTFVHPGLSHKQSDFDRMKAMVAAKIEPWYTSFVNLSNTDQAKYTYSVRGRSSYTTVTQDGTNYSALNSDVKAAYLNAIMWGVTGDVRHAEKAVEIFNAWQNLTCFTGGGTEALNVGRQGWQIVEAAEIIKSTYDGWKPADIQKFKDMLVYPGYSNTAKPASVNNNNGTFYWRAYMGDYGRHGNQDLFGWRLVMAMGVFLDNDIMYDRALRYFSGLPCRADDIPYQSGPPNNLSANPNSTNAYFRAYAAASSYQKIIPDYGYNGVLKYYIWENGQSQESSRDQDHCALGLGMVASMAEMAWNQGDDVYSLYDNRILTGYEWGLRYNLSYLYPGRFPEQPTAWEPTGFTTEENVATFENGLFIQRRDRTGRWYSLNVNPHNESVNTATISRGKIDNCNQRPICEMAIAHYGIRAGLPAEKMLWTQRTLDIFNKEKGYEKSGWSLDHLGWGGLTFHRAEWMAGDPCTWINENPKFSMPEVPCTIKAVDYDFYTGDGEGRTYHNKGTAKNNVYRTDGTVEIVKDGADYVVTNMETGEWLNYTLGASVTGTYNIIVTYKASSETQLSFAANNGEPLIETLSASTVFQEHTITGLRLNPGVSVLRMEVTGASNVLQLRDIRVEPAFNEGGTITFDGNLNTSGANRYELKWEFESVLPSNVRLLRSNSTDRNSAAILVQNLTATDYTDNTISGTVPSYYYWLVYETNGKTFYSDSLVCEWGYIYDNFENPSVNWTILQGTGNVNDGVLDLTLSSFGSAYVRRIESSALHAGNFPVLAFYLEKPTLSSVALHYDVSNKFEGRGDTYTGRIGTNIYYYDLRTGAFKANPTASTTYVVPEDNILKMPAFQIRIDGGSAVEGAKATLHWIGTFRSFEELNEFAMSTGHKTANVDLPFNYSVDRNTLLLSNIPNGAIVDVYSIVGQSVVSSSSGESYQEISLPNEGVFIVDVAVSGVNKSFKVLIK